MYKYNVNVTILRMYWARCIDTSEESMTQRYFIIFMRVKLLDLYVCHISFMTQIRVNISSKLDQNCQSRYDHIDTNNVFNSSYKSRNFQRLYIFSYIKQEETLISVALKQYTLYRCVSYSS